MCKPTDFLFDLYGTLLDIRTDEEKSVLWADLAHALGRDAADGPALRAEYLALCRAGCGGEETEFDLTAVFGELLARNGRNPADALALARRFRLASREHLTVFPCVKECLAELRACGAGVYLLSNAQTCFTLGELEESGLAPFFDGILISSEAGVKKPSPKIFEVAFERFSVTAENSIYVGNDLRDDVLGAHRVGMRTVYVPTAQSRDYGDLPLPAPTFAVKDHTELKTLLLALAAGQA